ncbi:uncharacterized protein LOC123546668 [Mercenaria mercenaria]|uniref:uncharacterized protein LOC123546668 n=1 Tax=Mercenaria mercenaria TaxID=6596 RepID=UPI00234E4C6C|nr:uncharacterized protein LOC123546668 [Mercenaria mercenaria]
MSFLQETGYSQVLTFTNKSQAVSALKGHFLLYRFMAPINQFVEGLKLHDVLKLLQQHTEEAMNYFCEDLDPKADDVVLFFKPSFSSVAEEKSIEEVIIYNWNKFLKKIEKGKVTTPWVDLHVEDATEQEVTLSIGHALQALLGCTRIPLNIDCGLIEFDHISCHLPKVNTCAPSITFSRTRDLQNYSLFEETMMNIIVCSYGFGSA